MRKVREVKTETDRLTGVTVNETEDEYFVYSEMGTNSTYSAGTDASDGIKIAKEAMVYITSGIMDASRTKEC